MSLAEMEQPFTLTRPPVEASGTIIEVIREGANAIEKPTYVGTAVIAHSSPDSLVITPQEAPESDTAVIGEDRLAVAALIAENRFIGPFTAEDAEPETTAPEITHNEETAERGFGKNVLGSLRNTRLVRAAATAAISAGLYLGIQAETAQAESESAAAGNVPAKVNGSKARQKFGVGKAVEASNGIHYLEPATFSEVLDTTTSGVDSTVGDIELLKATCISEGLAMPEIFRKPIMIHAGIRPLDPRHYKSQSVTGVFVYPDVSNSCPPELSLSRVSKGQLQMQDRDNPKEWVNIGTAENPRAHGNDEERAWITYGPNHAWPEYLFNMCNRKGKFQKVRLVLTTEMIDTETHEGVAKEEHKLLVGVNGSCKEALGSKERTKGIRATRGGR